MSKKKIGELEVRIIDDDETDDELDASDEIIEAALGDDLETSQETAEKFRKYLLSKVTFPIKVTGTEDFSWEEEFLFGDGDKKEYKALKKENPSYTDTFDLLGLSEPDDLDDITAIIRRESDKKDFEIGLSWLTPVNKKSASFELLEAYSVWYANN